MSTRNKILIIGNPHISLLERFEHTFPDSDVHLIKDLKELKKEDIVMKIERVPDLIQPTLLPSVRSIDMGDMGNAYPMPHKSSRRAKKW